MLLRIMSPKGDVETMITFETWEEIIETICKYQKFSPLRRVDECKYVAEMGLRCKYENCPLVWEGRYSIFDKRVGDD